MMPSQYPSPATQVLPPVSPRRTWRSYFSLPLWRGLLQYAAQHRYWMQGAAIAYGLTVCLLLSGFALVAAITLNAPLQATVIAGLQSWRPDAVPPLQTLFTQTGADWLPAHRWWLLILTGTLALALGLKLVGTLQHLLRTGGQLTVTAPSSLRRRLVTVLLTAVVGVLLGLAYGFVLVTLPATADPAIAAPTLLSRGTTFLVQGLRWSLALSTMALGFGLLYRLSQKTAATVPILPGTLLATAIWAIPTVLLQRHVQILAAYHGLLALGSTVLLILLGLFSGIMGLLLGGHFNTLLQHYYPATRSRSRVSASPAPPSFESFKIQRRSNREL